VPWVVPGPGAAGAARMSAPRLQGESVTVVGGGDARLAGSSRSDRGCAYPYRANSETLPSRQRVDVIHISPEALREGCERASDLFRLNRLRAHDEAAASFDAVYHSLGIDSTMRAGLQAALEELVPVKGAPVLEATTLTSMIAGVLVGLLIADSAFPAEEFDLPVVSAP